MERRPGPDPDHPEYVEELRMPFVSFEQLRMTLNRYKTAIQGVHTFLTYDSLIGMVDIVEKDPSPGNIANIPEPLRTRVVELLRKAESQPR